MYNLNFIAIVGIAAAVSLAVGMASPAIAAFAQQDNMTMNMDDNMSSMGNMTESESLPSANETGISGGENPILP